MPLNLFHLLFPLAQAALPDTGTLERLRNSSTLGIPAIRKLLDEAVMPVAQTAIDLLPMVIMFVLLGVAAFLTIRLRQRQKARRVVQTVSALAFVAGVHPCMCMVRDVAIGAITISSNTLEAFKYLMVFGVVGAFTLVFGRVFCGWVCPLGYFQELSAAFFSRARRNRLGGVLSLAALAVVVSALVSGGLLGWQAAAPFVGPAVLILLANVLVPETQRAFTWARWGLAAALLIYTASYFFLLRPGTFVFIESVAVWWVMGLMVLALFVISDPELDARLKPLKFVSVGLIALIIVAGVYANGPFCIFFQSVVELSTVLSAMGIIALSGVLSNAWCRYLCPEGALLGLLSRSSRWKITFIESRCNTCRSCDAACPVEAIKSGQRDESSCIFCSKCIEACPTNALVIEDVAAPGRLGRPPAFVPLEALRNR